MGNECVTITSSCYCSCSEVGGWPYQLATDWVCESDNAYGIGGAGRDSDRYSKVCPSDPAPWDPYRLIVTICSSGQIDVLYQSRFQKVEGDQPCIDAPEKRCKYDYKLSGYTFSPEPSVGEGVYSMVRVYCGDINGLPTCVPPTCGLHNDFYLTDPQAKGVDFYRNEANRAMNGDESINVELSELLYIKAFPADQEEKIRDVIATFKKATEQ